MLPAPTSPPRTAPQHQPANALRHDLAVPLAYQKHLTRYMHGCIAESHAQATATFDAAGGREMHVSYGRDVYGEPEGAQDEDENGNGNGTSDGGRSDPKAPIEMVLGEASEVGLLSEGEGWELAAVTRRGPGPVVTDGAKGGGTTIGPVVDNGGADGSVTGELGPVQVMRGKW